MAHGVAITHSPAPDPWLRLLRAFLASLVALAFLAACGAADEPEAVGQPVATDAIQTGPAEIVAYAGTGSPRFTGDGGQASEAGMFAPQGLAVDSQGNLLITTDNRIRRVDVATGVITTVAGNGRNRYSGDGGPAAEASFSEPMGITVDSSGNIYVAAHSGARIRKIEAATGIVTTVGGGGIRGSILEESGDGGLATEARLREPTDVAVDGEGNIYAVAENRVRRVDAITGIISTFAGTGKRGLAGDGGPADQAELAEPSDLAVDSAGNVYIADTENHRVRRVDGATGMMSTLAGIGKHMTCAAYDYGGPCAGQVAEGNQATGAGYSGDGGPAIEAMLSLPSGVAIDPQGNLIIADGGVRVRKVNGSTGIITTVTGSGASTTAESGKIVVHTALLGEIVAIAVNDQGGIFLADFKNNLVHKIAASRAAP